MNAGLANKTVLVLSSSEALYKAIELNLNHHLGVRVDKFTPSLLRQRPNSTKVHCDLVVAAALSPASRQIVNLFKNSLAGQIVPLVVISDQPLGFKSNGKTIVMDFPFDINELYNQVREILER